MQKNYEFYYYPSRNIYYNVSIKDISIHWMVAKHGIPYFFQQTTEPPTLGDKEILHSQSPDIWLNNAVHIKQYNGHVIDITANDTASLQEGLVAERKTKKIVAPVTTQNKEPEKKPGFFKRLFGKKNK